jgi:DNA-binding NtrC family response regulator
VSSEVQIAKQRLGIIGNSPLLNRVVEVAIQVASTDLSVLINGESGVGKENIAKIIHQYSARKHFPFVVVNCGAIPKGTVDSELFGHEKGSYTDAKSDRKGYFQEAEGGTIFLDEVGELPLDIQVKLLRVLEYGEYMRLGSSKVTHSNVRVVAATNVNMQKAIEDGRFREDLYYRLSTIPLFVPSLRERKEDINLLFRKFALDFAEKYKRPPVRLSDEAQQLLREYYFSGNIRQLKNIAEQISVIEGAREISIDVLRNYLPEINHSSEIVLSKIQQEQFNTEREILYKVLFDMKKDMNDLKQLVNEIISKTNISVDSSILSKQQGDFSSYPMSADLPSTKLLESSSAHLPSTYSAPMDSNSVIQELEDYEEVKSPITLEEAEKEVIRKMLNRCGGRRKDAAKALNISERTLFRKIKQYGL